MITYHECHKGPVMVYLDKETGLWILEDTKDDAIIDRVKHCPFCGIDLAGLNKAPKVKKPKGRLVTTFMEFRKGQLQEEAIKDDREKSASGSDGECVPEEPSS